MLIIFTVDMDSSTISTSSPASHVESIGSMNAPVSKIFNELLKRISAATEYTDIIYENIAAKDGEVICQSLMVAREAEERLARYISLPTV